jgi:beta-glucosidase
MCSYNKVGGVQSCENAHLLTDVLRRDWGWRGYVMSDWGATHSTVAAANAGLDQDSGFPFDKEPYFGPALRDAVRDGRVPQARLDDMVRHILRAMFAHGLIDRPVAPGPIDFAAHAVVTRADAEQGAVLLKNAGAILPLGPGIRRIAVIGAHADAGVLSGGGSSQVYPVGGVAVKGIEPRIWPGPVVYYPSSPLRAIRAQAPHAVIAFADGGDPAAAARLAAESDVAVVFASQWATESEDVPFALRGNQDALIAAVAAANPHVVVVLETGGAVAMPWLNRVAAVLEAWYPGTSGGDAIAALLFGRVNPSGRLPLTFPRDEGQLPRRTIDGTGLPLGSAFDVGYPEGAAVGYKWYDSKGLTPLFPFGHGLSYTSFDYGGLSAELKSGKLQVRFHVRNRGRVRGMAVPQIYVSPVAGGWEAPKRLGGWKKVDLAPGAGSAVELDVDPRLLAVFDGAAGGWRIAGGRYTIALGASSRDLKENVTIALPERRLPATWRP